MIQEAFFEFERLLKLGEPTGKADFAFHREIASATNNPFYVEMLDALGDRAIPCDVTSPWYSIERAVATNTSAGCSASIWSSSTPFRPAIRRRRATPCARI